MHITANQIGHYDRADQPIDQPTYNPPFDAPCPFCGEPITPTDVRTHSLLYVDDIHATDAGEIVGIESHGARSYFYRTHRTCHEAAAEEERHALDGMAFDAVEALPSAWKP